jgi:hypothetical protein
MKETTDYLENIVGIVHAARKKNKKIGARLRHFYASKDRIKIQLTGKGWVSIETAWAVNGITGMSQEDLKKVVDSFELK